MSTSMSSTQLLDVSCYETIPADKLSADNTQIQFEGSRISLQRELEASFPVSLANIAWKRHLFGLYRWRKILQVKQGVKGK